MNELDLLVAMKNYIEVSEEMIAILIGDDRPGTKRDVIDGMPPLCGEIQQRLLRAESAIRSAD